MVDLYVGIIDIDHQTMIYKPICGCPLEAALKIQETTQ